MKIKRLDSATAFRDRVWPLLLAREAENSLMVSIVGRLTKEGPASYGENAPQYWTVEDNGEPVAAALMTPPHRLNLTRAEPLAVEALADGLLRSGNSPSGVMGPTATAHHFAEHWRQGGGCEVKEGYSLRLYRLGRVQPIPLLSGEIVTAGTADFELAKRWHAGFCRDIESPPMPDEALRRRLGQGTHFFWCDPDPVSMAAVNGTTPHGARIGGVYTPPERRRRGYATALVAAVSQRQLDADRQFCILFTDLTNPTPNRIYQQVGYEPVCDFQEYDFVPPKVRNQG